MKKYILLFYFFFLSINIYSQAPQGFNYQAIVRDASGNIKANTGVQFTFKIETANGVPLYSELHTTITNKYGLTNMTIGKGISNDDFSDIKWGSGTYMLNVNIDGVDVGTTQLMSVPYALYAVSSGSSSGGGGVGISSTVDNGDGTFTLNYTDGTSFTTTNLSGKSAYQLWIDKGNTGTEEDFLGSLEPVTLENTNYLSLNGQELKGNTIPIIAGGTGAVDVTAARTNLGVDPAGTDNSTDVTLGGTSNYLTISGQQIIRGKVNLSNSVIGTLPIAQGGTGGTTAEEARTALGIDGLEGSDPVTLENTNYLSLNGQEIKGNTIPIIAGGTGAVNATAARSNLGVDVAGTDNSTEVTLGGTSNYLTISGQQIIRGKVNLSNSVTGTLPISQGGTGAVTAEAARVALGVDGIQTNVSTNLTFDRDATTLTVKSSDGDDAILPVANTDKAGVMSAALFDEVAANTSKSGITSAQASAITANTAKETNVSTNLSTSTSSTTLTVASSDGTDAVLPVATTSAGGVMSAALFDEVAANTSKSGITSAQASAITANTAKETNVSTNLSTSTSSTTLTVASSDGTDAVLPVATTSAGGVMSAALFDEVAANTSKSGITSAQASAITANTAKETNVSTNLSTSTSSTTLTVASSDGTDAVLPVATTSAGGVMSAALFDEVAANTSKSGITSAQASAITANTAKETNVSTNLSTSTSSTTLTVASSDGTDAVLPVATTSAGGVMSAALFDEVAANTSKSGITSAQASAITANTAKETNVSTNLSTSTSSTTLTVASSDGTDAVLPVATTSAGGVMSAALFDEVAANTAKTGITSSQATTIANLGTISTQDANAVNIDGGAIDGVTIGTNGVVTQAVIDNINIDGATIGHTGDTDLLTLASGIVTVAGEVSLTTLDIGGTNVTADAGELNIMDGVTATTAELNIMDGNTSATSTTVVDADRIVLNDDGTMKQVAVTDLSTYIGSGATKLDDLSDVLIKEVSGSEGLFTSIYIGHDPSSNSGYTNATNNVSVGVNALDAITTADGSVAIGYDALGKIKDSGMNTVVGYNVMKDAVTNSHNNTAVGYESMVDAGDGATGNSALGKHSLKSITTGNNNFAGGVNAGYSITTGSNNVVIGQADISNYNGTNQIVIGYQATGKGNNMAVIGDSQVTELWAAEDGQATVYTGGLVLEGATANAHETTLGVVDPTADATLNLPAMSSGTYYVPVLAAASTTAITSTPAELNIMDGNTSATSTTVVDADRIVLNDDGTMKQIAVTDLNTYLGNATKLDDLSDAKSAGDNFTGSLLIGHQTTGTLNAATYNTAVGLEALDAITSGDNNVAVGSQALTSLTTAIANTAIGHRSLRYSTTGGNNTAIGTYALQTNTTGYQNTAVGVYSMSDNTTGYNNTSMGNSSLSSNTQGIYNTAIGLSSLGRNTTASYNTAVGAYAAAWNTTGASNTSVGYSALNGNTTGTRNIAIGPLAYDAADTENDNLAIGYDALGGAIAGGEYNVAIGNYSLDANTSGDNNVAIGYNALTANTTGYNNTASGLKALEKNTIGDHNTAVGSGALYSNIEGNFNTASGSEALFANTYGEDNTASGWRALYANTTGDYNTASGYRALWANSTGDRNIAIGYMAYDAADTENDNLAIGYDALGGAIAGGEYNVAIGNYSLDANTSGDNNVAIGYNALTSNTTGYNNTASGIKALNANTSGFANTASGYSALYSNTTGAYNTASGYSALYKNTTGNYNTASGNNALQANTSGSDNTASGYSALYSNTTGTRNIAIGSGAYDAADTENDNLAIGYDALGGAIAGGEYNVAIGNYSLDANTSGDNNVAIGYNALTANTTGIGNIAIGYAAYAAADTESYNLAIGLGALGGNIAGGEYNVAIGNSTLDENTSGDNNVVVGYAGLASNTTGANNTASGYEVLYSNTTGSNNTAVGNYALWRTQTGSANTAIGDYAMKQFRADGNTYNTAVGRSSQRGPNSDTEYYTGSYNTSIGSGSLKVITSGSNNTALGYYSQYGATITGDKNTSVGATSMQSLVGGTSNSAVGYGALYAITGGDFNNALGKDAIKSLTTGDYNIGIGNSSLRDVTNGDENVAIGQSSLQNNSASGNTAIGHHSAIANTSGTYNTAVGYKALAANTTADYNTAVGYNSMLSTAGAGTFNTGLGARSLESNTTGDSNTGIGVNSMFTNSTGDENTGVGRNSLYATTGSYNTSLGWYSADEITSGTYNTVIGHNASASAATAVNQTVIGAGATGQANNSVTLGNANVTAVYAAQDGEASVYASALKRVATANTNDLLVSLTGNYDASVLISSTGTGADAISIDATAGSMVVAPSLADGQTLKLGKNGAVEAIFSPHGTAANEKFSLTNTAGTATDAIALTSTAGGITLASSAGLSVTGDTHTFSSANTTDPLFIIKNTTNDANSSRLQFVKDKGAAGANNDVAGLIQFYADDDGENSENFAQISAHISSAADNAEGGKLSLSVASHDGEMNDGLVLTDGNAEDEIDVTIGSGTSSNLTVPGYVTIGAGAGAIISSPVASSIYIGKFVTDDAGYNTGIGRFALNAVTGDDNTAIGYSALGAVQGGAGNVAVGGNALGSVTGGYNVGIGYAAGKGQGGHGAAITSGSNNVVIGKQADVLTANADNQIVIGADAIGKGVNTAVIGNTSITEVYAAEDGEATLYAGGLVLEGATANAHETTLGVVDPTADATLNLPAMSAGTYYVPVLAAASTTAITSTPEELNIMDGVTSSAAELNILDGSVANTVVNSKGVVYGGSGQIAATTVTASGAITANNYVTSSDVRLKENILSINHGLDFIMKLNPVSYMKMKVSDYFNYSSSASKEMLFEIGLLAQDVKEISEELGFDNKIVSVRENGIHYMNYQQIMMPMINAMQEQQQMIESQQQMIEDLKANLKKLEKLIIDKK